MQNLSYGYKKPETNDTGTALWTALEDNIQRLNDHSHNGVNSASLNATSIVSLTATAASGNWASYSGPIGHYRQQITLPAGLDFDTVQIGFHTSAGAVIFPTVEKVSDTQFYVYSTNNTIDFIIQYGG